jgi:translation initiation factor 2B subunit (eIF-2B alpha/beta/delta family)
LPNKQLPPKLAEVVVAIRDDLIGGAADMARETARAFASLASDNEVTDARFGSVFDEAMAAVLEVSPSIMPVARVLHTLASAADQAPGRPRVAVGEAAEGFVSWLDGSLDTIASIGADLIEDNGRLFLYSMSSTVYRMIEAAVAGGKQVSVVTTESRPGNEGLVTLERLCPKGVRVDIGIDAAMVQLMSDCTAVYVGSDDVTSAGDCLAKVGCYPTALAAHHFGLPYFVAGDTSKFDPSSLKGVPMKIREMPASDIVPDGAPENGRVRNPVFEVVPARLITAYVTEIGILHPGAVYSVMGALPWSDRVGEMIAVRHRTHGAK